MSTIFKIPNSIINKIAAGEVIERPFNIVKELVENSIDSNADEIIIKIENGGLDNISVQDNGIGINRQDLEIAFELHTTSKILNDDIYNISTLGFRGEALASIASVSRIECKSKVENNNTGNQIIIEGGTKKSINAINCQNGTFISVTGLFFNIPARRKFLKSSAVERKKIFDLVTHYCLIFPQIRFSIEEKTKDGNIIKKIESPQRKAILSAIFDVLGPEIANELIPFHKQLENWKLDGFISKPILMKRDRSLQFISVNGRPITDKEITGVVEEAYGSQLMKSSHPVIILNLKGPYNEVDFNVHPQKLEIRFKTDEKIYINLHKAINDALSEFSSLPELTPPKLQKIKTSKNEITQTEFDSILNEKSLDKFSIETSETILSSVSTSKKENTVSKYKQTSLDKEESFVVSKSGKVILGHLMNKFGVVESNDELWLVDVHAADERINFEKFENSHKRQAFSQQLLKPLNVQLEESNKQILLDQKDVLQNFGLKISNSDKTGILVHTIPVYFEKSLNEAEFYNLFDDIIHHLNNDENEEFIVDSPFDIIEYNIVARLACHGSIRSGYPVSKKKIGEVVDNLLLCKNPWTCAHGRPTILRIKKSNLDNWFKR